MPQLFCVLEEGGRVLLTKAQGNVQVPSFPTVGLLCSLATYAESASLQLQSFSSSNVRVVYRRFPDGLLFVLATSNLLLGNPAALTVLLQHLYAALQLLLGRRALTLDSNAKVDNLRKRLRGLPSIGPLLADDVLAPCLLLSAPQVFGLALQEKALLQGALGRAAAAAGTSLAAVLSEGYYLAATPAWWATLTAREALLLQHVVSHDAGKEAPGKAAATGGIPPVAVHLERLERRQQDAPMHLHTFALHEGAVLVLLLDPTKERQGAEALAAVPQATAAAATAAATAAGPAAPTLLASPGPGQPGPAPGQAVVLGQQQGPASPLEAASLQAHFAPALHVLTTPLWSMPPVPQFAPVLFDLAIIVEASPPCATLLWGHAANQGAPAAFNPMVSPTLRRQMSNSNTSPGHRSLSLQRAPSTSASYAGTAIDGAAADAATAANMQLFFKSSVDRLVAFLLQTCCGEAADRPGPGSSNVNGAFGSQSQSHAASVAGGEAATEEQGGLLGLAAPGLGFAGRGSGGHGSGSGSAAEPMEVQAVVEGTRLVALVDQSRGGPGISVFVAMPTTQGVGRQQASEAAATLRSIFAIAYQSGAA